MLGKTNLTAIEKGTIVEDIADYRWNTVHVGSTIGNLKKVISAGNILAGITIDMIVYTKDGENWETKEITLDNGDELGLTDITYGNGKYVIVGYHTNDENYIHGLVIITEDFIQYDIIQDWFATQYPYSKPVAVSRIDDNFVIYTIMKSGSTIQPAVIFTDLRTQAKTTLFVNNYIRLTSSPADSVIISRINQYSFKLAKKSDGAFICYIRFTTENEKHSHAVYTSKDGKAFTRLTDGFLDQSSSSTADYNSDLFAVFECKDSLYFNAITSDLNYKLTKLISETDTAVMSSDTAYRFADAVYFNKSEIFINDHEMLIVKAGESITEKSLEDLVEITYDFSMISIKKAFDKLYIFGSNGNILVSSNEIIDEESIAVQTMSATRALYDAKTYADKRYEELEARIAALEAAGMQS